jgi:sugar (pentulose or hexulose) kinase
VARRYVIGVDSGTTSCKVIAWDRSGGAANMSAQGRRRVPDSKNREICERMYTEVYRSIFPKIRALSDRLDEITRNGRSAG